MVYQPKKIKIQPNREERKMYETVKTVKSYQITRRVGTTGYYKVVLEQGKGFEKFKTFRTIKAAAEYIETSL